MPGLFDRIAISAWGSRILNPEWLGYISLLRDWNPYLHQTRKIHHDADYRTEDFG